MTKAKQDLLVGAVVIVLGAWAFREALSMALFFSGAPGPGFFPLSISGLLILLGAGLVIQSVRPGRARRAVELATPDDDGNDEGPPNHKRVAMVAAGWIGSIALIAYAGFVPAMIVLVLYLVLVVEGKRTWYAPLGTLLIPILSYIAFGLLLHVHLPVGPLGY